MRRFDSGSVFCRLLDDRVGGYYSIRPVGRILDRRRRYVGATMVLETTMRVESGTLVLTDAFAMRVGGAFNPQHELLRSARCDHGEVEVDIEIVPRFDYGSVHPWLRLHDDGRISAVGGDDALVIHGSLPFVVDRDAARVTGRHRLRVGETIDVTMISQPAHLLDTTVADADSVSEGVEGALSWWERWSAATVVDGPHAALLERSALILKSLCCAPTGSIIAAPTTSLPEIPGGSKNWDYRYCWVRDATLTLEALAAVGHREVAQGFRDFIMRSSAGRGDELQIMYGAYGERRLPEVELDHLAGWRGSLPVRIGNGAASQTQLDVYGHLLDAAHLWHERCADSDELGPPERDIGIDADEWRFLSSVVDQAAARSDVTDAGIWELRGAERHYVHSKVMVWVALDRGIRLVEEHGFQLPADRLDWWHTTRAALRTTVESRGVDPTTGNFVQSFGSTDVDASLLKLPLVGFIDANDERMIATVDAIQRDLGAGGMLRRFRGDGDGVSGSADGDSHRHEGVFLLCTLWLVEVLSLQGHVDRATTLFERVCAVANDVGLFAEEYDPENDELLGNYPQAFTHLGFISAERRLRSGR